jgi:hypothetical protein
MSYKSYEFTNTAATRAAFFAAIQAFLVAIGWELHDAIDADTVVYKSKGESGNEPTGYIWIDAGTSTYIQFIAYQWWNSATHTGLRPQYAFNAAASQISATYCASAATPCIFAGDKNFVIIVNNLAASLINSGICFGHIPGRFDPTVATAMGTAGTAGTLLVSSTANMGVGKTIQICGESGEGCDKLVISSVPDATNVVVSALPRNYGTGSVIGAPASVFGIAAVGYQYFARFYPTSYWGAAGTTATTTNYHAFAALTVPALPSVLVYFPQKYYSAPVFVADVSASAPGAYLGMFYQNFISFFGPSSINDCMIANADESIAVVSTATGASATTLVDSAKSWGIDTQIGRFIVITANTGVGQVRKITDNDGTTLTIGNAWETNPDATSEYKVVDYVYRMTNYVLLGSTNGKLGILITETSIPS